jgi:DNA-directed RNA polymerase specialized sigma24 family protein
MRTAIPTEMLTRLASATPEVYAAMERLLGLTENQTAADAGVEPASDELALKLFALLKSMESETRYRKAPVLLVFTLYCVEGLTREQVAKECRCSLTLAKIRLRAIEKKLGRKPAALRAFSSQFQSIADSLADPRARRIDRLRAMDGSDPDDE